MLYAIANLNAQSSTDSENGCFSENACYDSSQIYSQSYVYATPVNVYKSSTSTTNLEITVYSPYTLPSNIKVNKNWDSSQYKRPFILLIHGGGFRSGCSSFLAADCIEFARRGYVAATIEYRKGWLPKDETRLCKNSCNEYLCPGSLMAICNPAYNDSLNFAVYRATQDAAAAMRFVVHYAATFNIDLNALYVGGYSAGSITALNLSYTSQSEFIKIMPTASAILGSLNTSGNNFTDKYKIAGIYNNWGSINDTIYINGKSNKIPMIAFHGIDDSIVPYAKNFPLNCTNGAYGYSYGSKCIYQRLVNKYPTLPVELYACYGSHGIFGDEREGDLKSLYRLQKAVCFFKRVRAGDQRQTFIEIDENDTDISYQQLISISPVDCSSSNLLNTSAKSSAAAVNTVFDNNSAKLLISPNPAQSTATLCINFKFKKANIALADMRGRILWKKENETQSKINLPIANFKNGLYMVIVKSDELSEVIKLSILN